MITKDEIHKTIKKRHQSRLDQFDNAMTIMFEHGHDECYQILSEQKGEFVKDMNKSS